MRALIAAAVMTLLAGCVTGQGDNGRTSGSLDNPRSAETDHPTAASEAGRSNRFEEHWSCKDVSLTAVCGPDDDPYEHGGCRGTVKVGDFPPQDTQFHIAGVIRKWNWCLEFKDFSFDCLFVIETNGWGRYYDFSSVPPGDTTKPQEVTKCEKT